jgi:hypothetical protein
MTSSKILTLRSGSLWAHPVIFIVHFMTAPRLSLWPNCLFIFFHQDWLSHIGKLALTIPGCHRLPLERVSR